MLVQPALGRSCSRHCAPRRSSADAADRAPRPRAAGPSPPRRTASRHGPAGAVRSARPHTCASSPPANGSAIGTAPRRRSRSSSEHRARTALVRRAQRRRCSRRSTTLPVPWARVVRGPDGSQSESASSPSSSWRTRTAAAARRRTRSSARSPRCRGPRTPPASPECVPNRYGSTDTSSATGTPTARRR